MTSRALLVVTVLGFALAACAGDDDERKRAEAAEWCEITSTIDGVFDETDGSSGPGASHIPVDQAAEWVDVAPKDIRSATERAARILRELATDPQHPDLAGAREEIGAYAADYCPTPARCIADVEGNPKFPCIHPIEARRRR